MTESHIKEELSISYTKAISASAGMTGNIREKDYGIDGCINDVIYNTKRRAYRESGFAIDFQLKATINAIPKNGTFLYDLEVKNYLDLIDENVGRNRILILYILPRDKEQWVKVTSDKTILQKCAYWCSLKGMPDVQNKSKVRVKIPSNQLLTSTELIRIMSITKGGGTL